MKSSIVLLFISIVLFQVSISTAAVLDSFCHTSADQNTKFNGKDINELLPIASVSKIFTAHWGLTTLGSNYQFITRIFLSPNADGTWDLHFQGSRDPYFGKESYHFLVSELNKIGVVRIRNLSFDENFKTYWNVTSNAVAMDDYTLESPTPETVLKIFNRFQPFLADYSLTAQRATSLGLQFFPNPQFQIQNFSYIPSNQFTPQPNTQIRTIKSAPLFQLIKEMNRNSNNHAANQIFQKLGGFQAYAPFAKQRLGLTSADIRFVNGSGGPLWIDTVKTYNHATCASVLKALVDTKSVLATQNKNMSHILAMVGGDLDSTVNRTYLNPSTNHTMIAKTGTVNPAITLGGMVSTHKGNVFFFYNMKTKNSSKDRNQARAQIKVNITNLIDSIYSGGQPMGYQVIAFNPYNPSFGFDSSLVTKRYVALNNSFTADAEATSVENAYVTSDADQSFAQQFKTEPEPEAELLLGSFE